VQYRDPEGDCVNVTTEAELQEAVRVFLSAPEPVPSLKFSAVTRRQAEFQEQVAEPLVQSVEHLMQALGAALERLKADANFASSARAQPAPLSQAAKDGAESPTAAAGGFSSFAQGLVGQINRLIPEKKAGEAELKPAVQAPVVAAVATAPAAVAAPPAAVVAPHVTFKDEQEEQAQMPSMASSVAFSEAEVKWAEQLSMVNSIFPNATPARVIDILEKSDGDLNIVLNVLTEEN